MNTSSSFKALSLISALCFSKLAMAVVAPAGLVPAGLSPGDTFFVIFTTSTTINACYDLDPTNIDTLATNAAAAGTQTNGVTGWKALYIHQANGAGPIVNTVQASGAWGNVTNRPIYTTAGVLVANSRDDMFDGTSNGNNGATGTDLLAPIDLDESGNVAPQYVYTGFDELGMPATANGDGTGVNAKLGTNLGTGCRVGESPQVRRRWADSTMAADARSVYVLSPLLEVPGAVPSSALAM
jgi:hypothetical protein